MDIECAKGDKLQYTGYVELDLTVNEGLPKSSVLKCLFLVSPDTEYSSRFPVIIGTK